jgi:hypothetical protein
VIRANVHNFAFVVGFALLGFLMLRMLAKTRASGWPVIGQVLQLTGMSAAPAKMAA